MPTKRVFEIQRMILTSIIGHSNAGKPQYLRFDILTQLKKHGVKNRWIVFVTSLNLKMEDFKDYFMST